VAWVSLEAGDDEPAHLWRLVLQAIEGTVPLVPRAVRSAFRPDREDVEGEMLPALLNWLGDRDRPLAIVLDDYHVLTSPACHRTVAAAVDHLPRSVQLVIATRADPPLPLGRLRARGELTELRTADLRFSAADAATLLEQTSGVHLSDAGIARLVERTEGWAAGLQLAALSLRGQGDPDAFVRVFAGDHRHVVDYLGAEVLAAEQPGRRDFLLGTAILDRLCGSLCDAVLGRGDSADVLSGLERDGVFVVALDDRREWFRYHHLFGELLRAEVRRSPPRDLRGMHRRASAWHREHGDTERAVAQALAARDRDGAAALVLAEWTGRMQRGDVATLGRWLADMGEDNILADPSLAVVAAHVAMGTGGDAAAVERYVAVAEAADPATPMPGIGTIELGAIMARAWSPVGNVSRAIQAAERAMALAGPAGVPRWLMASLAYCRLLAEDPAGARAAARPLAEADPDDVGPLAVAWGHAVLALVASDVRDGVDPLAPSRAARATLARSALLDVPQAWLIHAAAGRAQAGRGSPRRGLPRLERALELRRRIAPGVGLGHALLLVAEARAAAGDSDGARAAIDEAHGILEGFPDPGGLLVRLDALDSPAAKPEDEDGAELSERERTILRLLAGPLSQREIARELDISFNTVKTHTRAIYRKLGVGSRQDAIAVRRGAATRAGTAARR
jgi:ATP/maltotriose-dependent transcriptional regulator MalT